MGDAVISVRLKANKLFVDGIEVSRPMIKAAPDMYEALELVAKSGAFSCFEDHMWDVVNDALAKARGEQ